MHRLSYCLTEIKTDSHQVAYDSTLSYSPVSDADRSAELTSQWKEQLRDHLSSETWLTHVLQTSKSRALACRHGQHWANMRMNRQNLYFVSGCLHWLSTQHVLIMQSCSKVLPHCSQKRNPLGYITDSLSSLCVHMQPYPAITPAG